MGNNSFSVKVTLTISILLICLLFPGCMESAADRQSMTNTLNEWKAAYVQQDLDKIMSVYSEDYSGQQGEGKTEIRSFLQSFIDSGSFGSTEMDIDDAIIKIKGDTDAVEPITYEGDWGQMRIKNTFKKEGGTWRVIAAEESY